MKTAKNSLRSYKLLFIHIRNFPFDKTHARHLMREVKRVIHKMIEAPKVNLFFQHHQQIITSYSKKSLAIRSAINFPFSVSTKKLLFSII